MWHIFSLMEDGGCFERKGPSSFLRPDCFSNPSGALGCGRPFAVQFLMEFSATEQKSSVPVNLERVGKDDMAINP